MASATEFKRFLVTRRHVLARLALALALLLPGNVWAREGAEAEWRAGVFRWFDRQTDDRTGLVASYDETTDSLMTGQAAVYDQALALILFTEFEEYEHAERLADTLERMWLGRGLPNMITSATATAGMEATVHTGPNAWVALAIYRLYSHVGEPRYLELALAIADWIVKGHSACATGGTTFLQPQEARCSDPDGGGARSAPPWLPVTKDKGTKVAHCAPSMGPAPTFTGGGTCTNWDYMVSTEHVIDVYALLRMLKDDPGVSDDRRSRYQRAYRDTAAYLVAAHDAPTLPVPGSPRGTSQKQPPSSAPRIRVGGDLTSRGFKWNADLHASDVYYWLVAAADDELLKHETTLPDLLAYADRVFGYFEATGGDSGKRPRHSGHSISGTDYVPRDTTAECCVAKRKGVHGRYERQCVLRSTPLVSVEWTGESVLAHQLVGEYGKADEMLRSMEELAIVDDHDAARTYPYATAASACVFPTGWLTPERAVKGGGLPGSIAGAAWVVFGRDKINPFWIAKDTPRGGPALLSSPRRLPQPRCPLLAEQQQAAVSTQTLVAAGWLCLNDDASATGDARNELAEQYAMSVIRRSVPARGVNDLVQEGPPLKEQPFGDLALRQAGADARCDLGKWALNDIGTAHLIAAMAQCATSKDCTRECAAGDDPPSEGSVAWHLHEISTKYWGACFYDPPAYAGEPSDRHEPGRKSAWHFVGDRIDLGSPGVQTRVLDAAGDRFPCLRDAWDLSWLYFRLQGAASVGYVNNYFFVDDLRHAFAANLMGRLSAGVESDYLSAGVFTGVSVARAYGLDDAFWSKISWLDNHRANVGIELLGHWPGRPGWLREFNPALGCRLEYVGYLYEDAPEPSLRDWACGAYVWSLARAHVLATAGLWGELGGRLERGKQSIWTVPQDSLWLSGTVLAGLRLWDVIEPYGRLDAIRNFWNVSDWDNNLRAGAGLRVPLIWAEGDTSVLLRVDGYWLHTVNYWDDVAYVPQFRPLDDVRLTLDGWFGLERSP